MPDTGDAPMPEVVRRIEIFTGAGRRRNWSAEEKAAVVAESLRAGETVSGVARRHGLTASQLFWWRRVAREKAKQAGDAGGDFAAVVVTPDALPRRQESSGWVIEIVLGAVSVRVREGADAAMLGAALSAIERMTSGFALRASPDK